MDIVDGILGAGMAAIMVIGAAQTWQQRAEYARRDLAAIGAMHALFLAGITRLVLS